MPYGPSATLQARMAQHYADEVAEFSLHDGETGETGAAEIAGVTRQPAAWTVTGPQADATTVTFGVPEDTQILAVGMWAVDGSFLDSAQYSLYVSTASTVDITVHWTYQQAVVT